MLNNACRQCLTVRSGHNPPDPGAHRAVRPRCTCPAPAQHLPVLSVLSVLQEMATYLQITSARTMTTKMNTKTISRRIVRGFKRDSWLIEKEEKWRRKGGESQWKCDVKSRHSCRLKTFHIWGFPNGFIPGPRQLRWARRASPRVCETW